MDSSDSTQPFSHSGTSQGHQQAVSNDVLAQRAAAVAASATAGVPISAPVTTMGGAATPKPLATLLGGPDAVAPTPVVQVLSPLGVEYMFLTISLFTAAVSLTGLLISMVNGEFGFAQLSFPGASFLVSLPLFAALFLRVKKRELANPALKQDASKRRATQFTQVASYIVCLFTLIGLVASVFAKIGGQLDTSIVKVVGDCASLLVVFGGMLAYYWHDEHKGW